VPVSAKVFLRLFLSATVVHTEVARTQMLVQQFLCMLRERHGEDLDQWLDTAFSSGIPEWRAFVRKLRQDQAAVQAGLVLKWNNDHVA